MSKNRNIDTLDLVTEEYELLPGFIRISPRICKTLHRTEFDVTYYGICEEYVEDMMVNIIFRFFLRDGDLYNVNLDGSDENKLSNDYFDNIDYSFQIHESDYKHIELHCPEILI